MVNNERKLAKRRELAVYLLNNASSTYIEDIERKLSEFADYDSDTLGDFRAHAIALRDEGATHVVAGELSVTFGPRPITADELAKVMEDSKAIAKEPEPVGDEAYLP